MRVPVQLPMSVAAEVCSFPPETEPARRLPSALLNKPFQARTLLSEVQVTPPSDEMKAMPPFSAATRRRPSEDDATDQQLLALLENRDVAPDALLPETGIPRDLERALSAAFITLSSYGTRASSVVRIHADSVHMIERSFDAEGAWSDVAISRTRTTQEGQ